MLGTDPLHEMPILDLRIRKAVRRAQATLLVATERPSALDGGAAEAVRYAPGDAAAFVRALAAALDGGADGGPYAKEATALAESLREVEDPVIVWGERLWRDPEAVTSLLDVATSLGMAERIGSGLLEVPSEANGRGLREVGCLPGAGPGLAEAPAGRNATEIRDALAADTTGSLLLVNADPVRTHPGTDTWKQALSSSFVVSIAAFEDESTAYANVILPAELHAEKEGTVTHPDGRLQRMRPNIPHPDRVLPGWRILNDLATALGAGLDLPSQPALLAAMADDVDIYSGITDEEIGGTGVRWQERGPGHAWSGSKSARPSAPDMPSATTPDRDGLVLGTYRDLWANEATERNPALRFLMPAQRLELSKADAERLEVGNGDQVTVSINGTSVAARVAIRERMKAGAAFLIEGTPEGNGNVLAEDGPQVIEVRKS